MQLISGISYWRLRRGINGELRKQKVQLVTEEFPSLLHDTVGWATGRASGLQKLTLIILKGYLWGEMDQHGGTLEKKSITITFILIAVSHTNLGWLGPSVFSPTCSKENLLG